MSDDARDTGHGFAVRDVARRYRVGTDLVRGWIRRAEIKGSTPRPCSKPGWVILPDANSAVEQAAVGQDATQASSTASAVERD